MILDLSLRNCIVSLNCRQFFIATDTAVMLFTVRSFLNFLTNLTNCTETSLSKCRSYSKILHKVNRTQVYNIQWSHLQGKSFDFSVYVINTHCTWDEKILERMVVRRKNFTALGRLLFNVQHGLFLNVHCWRTYSPQEAYRKFSSIVKLQRKKGAWLFILLSETRLSL